MFRSRLDQILNRRHPLFVLAGQIDWTFFEKEFGPLYVDKMGRPGLPIRLVVGLHYLKHTYNVSDEGVVERFLENPYWQYFCGFEFFQHHFPLDPSSLTRWRKRVGPEGMEKLLKETVEAAKREGLLKRHHMDRVNVDTTVQEKAVAFPTDARLYHKTRIVLVRESKRRGLDLRQTYERVGKRAFLMQARYSHARQPKRSAREVKRLKVYLGRVLRDVERKCDKPDVKMAELLSMAHRLLTQKRDDKNKLYSIFAPETECIAKGKAHKKYEFGCKVGMVSTSVGNWIVGIDALHGNPYDGKTLEKSLSQVNRVTGWKPERAYCDKGYRGLGTAVNGTRVHLTDKRRKSVSRWEWMWLKRRAAIEPIIGHVKSDHRMDRNFLKGTTGDRMNAMMAGCGFNLRKLLRSFLVFVFGWLFDDHFDPDTRSQGFMFKLHAA